MNIKKISWPMAITTLSVSPLLILASCSSVTYVTLIPKILEDKINQIQTEIATDGITKWIQDRSTWTKEQWLVASNPATGYISGGNVIAANILEIKVSVIENVEGQDNKVNFYIGLDKTSLNRFLNDKTEWTTQVLQKKPINN